MTLTELKAKAYDIIAEIERLQKELDKTNREIIVKMNEQNGNIER